MVSIKDVLFNIKLKVNADLESKVAKSNFKEIYRADLSRKYWKMKICRILYLLNLYILKTILAHFANIEAQRERNGKGTGGKKC
jgi:hypothetical protein